MPSRGWIRSMWGGGCWTWIYLAGGKKKGKKIRVKGLEKGRKMINNMKKQK